MKIEGGTLTIRSAPLPSSYVEARAALAKCEKVDECQGWADKAAAIASYARQANDDTLHNTARRIQLRAVERGGELLSQIEPKRGANQNITDDDDTKVLTRKDVADEAGLSDRQRVTMLRVANVPEAERNSLIESDSPPTVTELAELGTKRKPTPKPEPYRNEWVDWITAVRDLARLPECGLAVLAQRSPSMAGDLAAEARQAASNLTAWQDNLKEVKDEALGPAVA